MLSVHLETYKKFFLVFLAFLFFLLPNTSFAQTAASGSAQYKAPAPVVYNPQLTSPNSPHTASLAIYNFGHAMSCIMIGQSPISPCLEYKMYRDAQGMVKSVPVIGSADTNHGVLGMSLSMIGEVISTPPIRSSEFIANLGEQLGVKSANAQVGGSGSGVLAPIFKLWEVSRNIAYLAMILIFVLIGLMVMFRQKLNPQTVVSIQMALPGLVIGLVMITFSYFLASLISDIAFLGTNVVGYYFSLADPAITQPTQLPLTETTPKGTQEANVLTIFSRYTGILGTFRIKDALDSIWPYLDDPQRGNFPLVGGLRIGGESLLSIDGMDPKNAITTLANMLAIQFILPFGNLFGGKGQTIAALIPPVVTVIGGSTFLIAYTLSWIAMIALIYSMFKLLLRLINNLLSVIFLTISAPFYFLAASIPGRQGLVTTWMFNMLCNVLAFPAVFGVFYFVAFILKGRTSNCESVTGICDPLFAIGSGAPSITGNATFPLLGGFNLEFLNVLIAFGALMALPSIPDLICKAVGKPGQLGGIAAGAISGAIASGQKYQGQVQSGTTGFAGNVGRLTDTQQYHISSYKDGKPQYEVSPYQSHAGLINKIKLNVGWNKLAGTNPDEGKMPGRTEKKS